MVYEEVVVVVVVVVVMVAVVGGWLMFAGSHGSFTISAHSLLVAVCRWFVVLGSYILLSLSVRCK